MINFLSTTSQPSRFYNANFPRYISPSEYRPLQKLAPQKGPLKNISPRAYFWNFTVFQGVRGWTSGRSLPVQNFVEYPLPRGQCMVLLLHGFKIISYILMSSLPSFYYFQDFISFELNTHNQLNGVKLSKEKVVQLSLLN